MPSSPSEPECPFCRLLAGGNLPGNDLAVYFDDGYPVSPGHTLIIPRRHVQDYLGATADEKHALWELIDEVAARLTADRAPAGFNIGVNVGEAAGQTVMHLHLHVIPRYPGDIEDPRGGVRYVIPDKAKYWS